jgi:hypothetical protein
MSDDETPITAAHRPDDDWKKDVQVETPPEKPVDGPILNAANPSTSGDYVKKGDD